MKINFLTIILVLISFRGVKAQTWEKMEFEFGDLLSSQSYLKAENIANKMRDFAEKQYGDTSNQYITSLYYLSTLDIINKKDLESIKKLELAKSKFYAKTKKQSLLYCKILYQLGTNYYFIKKYQSADVILSDLLDLQREVIIQKDIDYIEAYRYYAENLLNIPGQEEQAINDLVYLTEQLVVLINKDVPIEKKNVLFTKLNNCLSALRYAYHNKGDIQSELKVYSYYTKIIDFNLPPSALFEALKNTYSSYADLGLPDDAQSVVKQILKILDSGEIYDLNSSDYHYIYSHWLEQIGQYQKANDYLQIALKQHSIKDVYPLYLIYGALAYNSDKLGKYELSIMFYKKKKDELIKEQIFGDYDLIDFNLNMANCFMNLHKNKEALSHIEEVLKNKDINFSTYRLALSQKSEILEDENDFFEAIIVDNKLFDISKKEILSAFPILSNSERESFIAKEKKAFYGYTNNGLKAELKNVPNYLSYNSFLFLKNLLLESNLTTKKMIASDNELKNKFQELDSLKNVLAYINLNESKFLKKEIEELESKLMRDFPTTLLETSSSKIDYKDIKQNLKSDECAIEYISFEHDNKKYYRALLAFSNNEFPISIHLTNKDILDSINKLVNENFSYDNLSGRTFELNKHLYYMFWEPLEPYLKGVKTIYYSPIDELNNMSFSTFVTNSVDTTYLMDKYNLQSVMSTAAIITNKTPNINNEPQSIALFGGVQYNLKTQNINNSELIASRSIRGVNQRSKQRDEVSELPFTQNEIDNVSVILQKAKWTILKESNIKATENKIKELESGKNPTILHFATHGFAFPDFVSNSTSTNIFEKAENPMQRSGLLFYGSGDTWQGKRDTVIKYTGEDGVLTAEEVSNLDLTNTKLVVMSACQSGLGAIKGTEGVYGLKRAFKLAGVENMIVSLWPVPDKETMELMNLFYEELVKTKDINESFQSAQKTMRYKYPSNPWAWGGFVLVR